ncbi:MAG: twin-arginine translocation signal domain-containing protein, partial [Candidatus Competibacter sp.]|nr:twin-arginine translocation signal domain-containing protein [Candidatus Competibacter sp.]
MIDQGDEQQGHPFEEPVEQERRDFLRGLGKWSQAVIGGVLLGGAATASNPVHADSWYNRPGGGWYNRPGGGWYNRPGGGWYNR